MSVGSWWSKREKRFSFLEVKTSYVQGAIRVGSTSSPREQQLEVEHKERELKGQAVFNRLMEAKKEVCNVKVSTPCRLRKSCS